MRKRDRFDFQMKFVSRRNDFFLHGNIEERRISNQGSRQNSRRSRREKSVKSMTRTYYNVLCVHHLWKFQTSVSLRKIDVRTWNKRHFSRRLAWHSVRACRICSRHDTCAITTQDISFNKNSRIYVDKVESEVQSGSFNRVKYKVSHSHSTRIIPRRGFYVMCYFFKQYSHNCETLVL